MRIAVRAVGDSVHALRKQGPSPECRVVEHTEDERFECVAEGPSSLAIQKNVAEDQQIPVARST